MVRLVIYKKGTDVTGTITDSAIRWQAEEWQFHDTLMDSQYLSFDAKSENPIDWHIGDFCYYRGVPYTLQKKPSITQNARRGAYGESFEYKDLKFESALADLNRCTILDVTPTTEDYEWPLGQNHTGNAVFTLQCCETYVTKKVSEGGVIETRLFTPVEYLMGIIKANLIRLFPNAGWNVIVDSDNTHTDDTIISFNNTNAADALKMVKETFNLYYCVIGRTIYVGYNFASLTSDNFDAQSANPTFDGDSEYKFGYGMGAPKKGADGTGLYRIEKKASGDGNIITRLRAYGSKRNLPYRYYNEKYTSVRAGGFFVTNLQLPNAFDGVSAKEAGNASRGDTYAHVLGTATDCYIDKDNNAETCEEGVWEGVGVWDGSDKDHEEIYPTIEKMNYAELRSAEVPDYAKATGSSAFPGYLGTESVNEVEAVDARTNYGDGIIINFEDGVNQTGTSIALSGSMSKKMDQNGVNGTFLIGQTSETQVATDYILSVESGVAVKIYADTNSTNKESNKKAHERVWAVTFYAMHADTLAVLASKTMFDTNIVWVGNDSESSYDGYYYVDIPHLPYVADGTDRKMSLTTDGKVKFYIKISCANVNDTTAYPTYICSVYNRLGNDCKAIWSRADVQPTYASTPFTMYVRDFGVDFGKLVDTGSDPILSMKTGACVACDFKLTGADTPEHLNGKTDRLVWKLTLERCWDESIGAYYPSQAYPINAGDKFVLLNCELPEGYIKTAELRLLAAATEYLKKVQEQNYTYSPSLDDIYIQNDHDVNGTKSIYWNLYAGVKFPLVGIPDTKDGELPETSVLIKSVTIKEGGLTPEIELTLDNEIEETIQQRINNTITRLTSDSTSKVTSELKALIQKSSSSSAGYNQYALSFVRDGQTIETYDGRQEVRVNLNYLRKDQADTASGKITFGDGLKISGGNADFGTFNTGIQGGRITNEGNGELKSLILRESLTVPELHYQRVEVETGTIWHTTGGGKIESVTVDEDGKGGTIKLRLVDGEIGAVAVNDICQGIFHLDSGNDVSTTDSRNGNFTFAGFKTVYFRIDEITESTRNSEFHYILRAFDEENKTHTYYKYAPTEEVPNPETITETDSYSDETHPQPQMSFAQYANTSNSNRQQCGYETKDYEVMLVGMTWWKYNYRNIQFIKGNLNGFSIDCEVWDSSSNSYKTQIKTLSGWGLAYGKAYQWGSIEKLDRKPSLVSQQLYFLANNSSTAPATSASGWTTTAQKAEESKPYLWEYWLYTYSDGSTGKSTVFLASTYSSSSVAYKIVATNDSTNIKTDGTYSVSSIGFTLVRTAGKANTEHTDWDDIAKYGLLRIVLVINNGTSEYSTYSSETIANSKKNWGSTTNTKHSIIGCTAVYATFEVDDVVVCRKDITITSDGKGITGITEKYGVSASKDVEPSSWGTLDNAKASWNKDNPYLWNQETTTYGDSSAVKAHIIAIFTENGEPGRSVTNVKNYYKASSLSSGESKDNGTWYENPASCTLNSTNKYLWNYEEVIYSSGDPTYTTPCIVGYFSDSPIIIDIDNEMDSVALDSSNNTTEATTIVVCAKLFSGSKVVQSGVSGNAVSLAGFSSTPSFTNGVAKYSWTIPASTNLSSKRYTATIGLTYNGVTYTQEFTLNALTPGANGEPAVVYNAVPSMSQMSFNRDSDGNFTISAQQITCGYTKSVGSTITSISNCSNASLNVDGKYVLYYRTKNNSNKWSSWSLYSDVYSSGVSVQASGNVIAVQFCISKSANTSDVLTSGNVIDIETVPIVRDGSKGAQGGNGDNGADGVQPNLFGYDAYIYPQTCVHTPTGFALRCTLNGSSNHYQVFFRKNYNLDKWSAGTYSISGKMKCSVYLNTFQVTADDATQIIGGNVTYENIPANTVKEFKVKYSATGCPYMLFYGSGTANIEVYDLKFEESSGFNGICTQFGGLSADSIKQNQNILLDTQFAKAALWRNFKGSRTEKLLEGVAGYTYGCTISKNSYVEALEQDISGKLQPETWYTLSYWCKLDYSADTDIRTFIYPNVSSYSDVCVQDGIVKQGLPDNFHQIQSSDSLTSWKQHTITFRTASSLPSEYYVLWRIQNTSSYYSRSRTLQICMPKLEKCERATDWCQNEADKTGSQIRPRGVYSSSETYVNNVEFRDVVEYSSDGGTTYKHYIVKAGVSSVQGVSPTNTSYWSEADEFQFIATDLLLTNKMYASVMSAVNAKIDELIVKKLKAIDASNNTLISLNDDGNGSAYFKSDKFQVQGSYLNINNEALSVGTVSSNTAHVEIYTDRGNGKIRFVKNGKTMMTLNGNQNGGGITMGDINGGEDGSFSCDSISLGGGDISMYCQNGNYTIELGGITLEATSNGISKLAFGNINLLPTSPANLTPGDVYLDGTHLCVKT